MPHEPMTVEPATREDLHEIVAIEADPAYAGLVGNWPLERHREEFEKADSRYFVLRGPEGEVLGFSLFQGFLDPDRKLHLKRIAVRQAGSGLGSRLLQEAIANVYRETPVNRIDLDVFFGNDRAKRAYEKVGFQTEGLLRDYHRRADGSFCSMWMMSILRADWEKQSPEGT